MDNITTLIKNKLDIDEKYIKNIISLFEDGNTIAFIARYRKDLTGNCSDERLLEFQNIYEYSIKLISKKSDLEKTLKEKGFLTSSIKQSIDAATTLSVLDDIYEPYKGLKNSRANDAINNGLEDLANIISTMKYSIGDIEKKAKHFLNNKITNIKDALDGAKDIIALRYAQDIKSKDITRNFIQNHGILNTKKTKTFQEDGLYKDLSNIEIKAKYIKSYKLLAIFRAVNDKQISMKIGIDEDYLINGIKKFKIPNWANSSKKFVEDAYIDGLKRLLIPSIKREFISILKEKASDEAIELFGKNLAELLIAPPLINQIILGMDPGYKTGCKIAVLDKDGKYLDCEVIYLLNQNNIERSSKKVLSLIKKYKVTTVAIGNGTGSKESALFISNLIKTNNLNLKYAVVSEIGASVYSASKIAQEEYPDLDVTIRGAISIAQRLRDPMSALVKIDPKSLGIGQYQHDLNQKKLKEKLNTITFLLVNKVGVDLNSASYKLLAYVSGISEKLAKNIIEYRESIGKYKSKKELLKVKGLGSKAYEQSVGFFRIKDGDSFLDNSGIHPESYTIANNIKKDFDISNLSNDDINSILEKYEIGKLSLDDMIQELKKPGFDIRDELNEISFCEIIKDIENLNEGDKVSGVVRNITDFGAFVDIGLKDDALLHISKISKKRISHPMDILSINQQLKNIIIDSIDLKKSRVSLSLIE
ncbi:MAG: Tex-like N-terminal domain-containing protein [Campylobacterota bacterium]|nr:Tex-like N-terminal domain-containing protein [Campylobacterota bacterium]